MASGELGSAVVAWSSQVCVSSIRCTPCLRPGALYEALAELAVSVQYNASVLQLCSTEVSILAGRVVLVKVETRLPGASSPLQRGLRACLFIDACSVFLYARTLLVCLRLMHVYNLPDSCAYEVCH